MMNLHSLGNIVRVKLLELRPFFRQQHLRQRPFLPTRQRCHGIMIPYISNQPHNLGPRQGLYIRLDVSAGLDRLTGR